MLLGRLGRHALLLTGNGGEQGPPEERERPEALDPALPRLEARSASAQGPRSAWPPGPPDLGALTRFAAEYDLPFA
jgi:hypothetical protein